jgi:hypothetical protein
MIRLTEYNWPSREEWAIRQRTAYYDDAPSVSDAVAQYASPVEIEQVIADLKARWKGCGREMTTAKKAAGSLAKQPTETEIAYIQRYLTMTEAEQDLSQRPEDFRRERKLINEVIRKLRDGELCWRAQKVSSVSPTLSTILDRRHAEGKRIFNEWAERVANTPIDDAAWEQQLEWRKEMENPEIERVEVGISVIHRSR